jgi:hypothetical protein
MPGNLGAVSEMIFLKQIYKYSNDEVPKQKRTHYSTLQIIFLGVACHTVGA